MEGKRDDGDALSGQEVRQESAHSIGSRIAWVRGSRSRSDFADLIRVHKNTLGNYERDQRVPDADFLKRMAGIGVNIHWLVTGHGPAYMRQLEKQSPSHADVGVEFQLVPQYDVEASAGGGGIVEREAEIGKLAFRHQWLREKGLSAKDLVVIRVRGDSMAPTIYGGSIVLVDTRQDHVTDDGIYVLLVGEHLVAKRLQVDLRGGLYIISDNPAYEEQHLTTKEAHELYIVGRVVWAAGDVY